MVGQVKVAKIILERVCILLIFYRQNKENQKRHMIQEEFMHLLISTLKGWSLILLHVNGKASYSILVILHQLTRAAVSIQNIYKVVNSLWPSLFRQKSSPSQESAIQLLLLYTRGNKQALDYAKNQTIQKTMAALNFCFVNNPNPKGMFPSSIIHAYQHLQELIEPDDKNKATSTNEIPFLCWMIHLKVWLLTGQKTLVQ